MKKQDFVFVLLFIALFLPFFLSNKLYHFYIDFNHAHGFIMAFIKFAVLATIGEVIGLRIRTGQYFKSGFGVGARMIYWGLFGLTIKMAFIIFLTGVPNFLEAVGLSGANDLLNGDLSWKKVLFTFTISASLNLMYAPILMTLHKITDMHITLNDGRLLAVLKPINFSKIMPAIDWNVQWNFVYKKTIPLFWIPMHTITFLLPKDFQILFAALLGIILGIFLAIAAVMGQN